MPKKPPTKPPKEPTGKTPAAAPHGTPRDWPANDDDAPAPNPSGTLVNRLGGETSPYLLQHADNPVAWQPWGEEAFAAARAAGKPVLLSVGYAACHWCHVMAHECFEDPAIAAQMNELFVSIKVDREERPDLDTIYQSALALLGQQGGWPLTMFLTPEGEPFWGGTYFPPEPRYGRPGFPQVLDALAAAYHGDTEKVAGNVAALKQALAKLSANQPGEAVTLAATDAVAERLVRAFDPFEGGLGEAPKFPQPAILKLLWRAWKRTGGEPFRRAVDLTLTKMSQGGIYDHLGGGYARYSVDAHWLVPHFEKMLYDNAQMLQCLTWAWQDTGNPLYAQRARETVGWLLREMMALDADGAPCGAFAATLDADSEGEEGKFYVWTETEIEAVLGAVEDIDLFKRVYDVHPAGNWEGKTILNRSAHAAPLDEAEEARLAAARDRLFAARASRVRPGWDDKVLADWNGLMIAALAEAAPVFGEPGWLAAAERAFAFVAATMARDGRLSHAWRRGRLAHPATLDDYACLCDAALALHQATANAGYLAAAADWVAVLDAHYWDTEGGGYFFTADDTERLLVRTKTAADNAAPAGNGVMLAVLARLHYLTGEARYRVRAEALVAAFAGELERNALPLATFLAGNELLQGAVQVAILGEPGAADTEALRAAALSVCAPDRVLQVVSPAESLPETHPASTKSLPDSAAAAYVCAGPVCSLPLTDPAGLARALSG